MFRQRGQRFLLPRLRLLLHRRVGLALGFGVQLEELLRARVTEAEFLCGVGELAHERPIGLHALYLDHLGIEGGVGRALNGRRFGIALADNGCGWLGLTTKRAFAVNELIRRGGSKKALRYFARRWRRCGSLVASHIGIDRLG